ncbi:ABC transporter permease subunit [Streptomyces sp. NPDC058001]|uniref:ABC transporter permease subunit n=1 Tax=Streptomyces sp. NPDC058001 TaxID=3346300 RepID=UPI0036E97564
MTGILTSKASKASDVPEASGPVKAPRGGARFADLVWLTWRQHRGTIVAAVALTVVLIGWMLVTYYRISDLVDQCGNTICAQGSLQEGQLTSDFGPLAQAGYALSALTFLPLILGLFWGAPLLAREHEQRTLALAWSQDVSPTRWLFGKLAVLGGLAAVLTGTGCVVGNALAQEAHVGTGDSLFEGIYFQATGWLPLTLAVAWFALGAAAGALTRRTTTAFGLVLALFIGRNLLMENLRPTFMTPLTVLRGFGADTPGPAELAPGSNALIMNRGSTTFVDASGGHHDVAQVLGEWCPMPPGRGATDPLGDCLTDHHILGNLIEYQPGSRLGTFHLIEAGSSLILAALCLALTWWAVRRTKVTG